MRELLATRTHQNQTQTVRVVDVLLNSTDTPVVVYVTEEGEIDTDPVITNFKILEVS